MSMTPTTHGTWRMVDGKLVDESILPRPAAEPTAPAVALSEQPAKPEAPPSTRRKAHSKPE